MNGGVMASQQGFNPAAPGAISYAGKSSLGTRLLDFGSLTGYSIGGTGTLELVSATVPDIGKAGNSIKVTVPAGTGASFEIPAWTAVLNPNSTFSLVFENQTLATGSMVWYMTVDGGYANHYYTNVSFNQYGLVAEEKANGPVNSWTVGAGSPTFSGITDGRFSLTAPAGENLVLIFHGLYAASWSPPIVQIIQDDCPVSGYTKLMPLLNKYGFKAGFSIIGSLIDAGGSLTQAQLAELYRSGHDLIPHGQFSLASFGTPAEALADIASNAAFLTSRGYARGKNCYAYPNGTQYYSATDKTSIIDYLKANGFKAGYLAAGARYMPYAGFNKFLIPRYAVNAAVNVTTLLNNLDTAISAGQGMVLMLHDIVASGATGDQSNQATVETIFDGIATRANMNNCVVLPPSEALTAQDMG